MKTKRETVRVSIIGFGYVGSGVAEVIRRKHDDIAEKHGIDIKIVGIADLKGVIVDENGLSDDAILKLKTGENLSDMTSLEVIKEIEHEVKRLHKHTTDSIEYASLIQQALIPEDKKMTNYFNDFFTIWQPKDIVGGDIFLFEELRNKDECLLMVIDCTGHGVPGAFVTMLVKAIERQVVANIQASSKEVSPALILEYFNVTMKKLLKQESEDAISNAGFDGGILYYNRKENYIKYAGAETPLFYI